MGAVGKRIAVAAIGRVTDLCGAGRAGGGIGDDPGMDNAAVAGGDPEVGAFELAVERTTLDGVDAGQGRALCQ